MKVGDIVAIYQLDDPSLDKEDSGQGNANVWSFIVWQESATEDFIKILNTYHIPMCISPLHNRDKKEDGSPKKAHWHVIVKYNAKHSYSTVKAIADSVNASFPVRVGEIFGLTRYFIHLDDPDKASYERCDMVSLSGYDIDFYMKPSHSTIEKTCIEIEKLILDMNITEYEDLIVFCLSQNELYYYVVKSCFSTHFYRRLQSRRNKLKELSKTKNIELDEGCLDEAD